MTDDQVSIANAASVEKPLLALGFDWEGRIRPYVLPGIVSDAAVKAVDQRLAEPRGLSSYGMARLPRIGDTSSLERLQLAEKLLLERYRVLLCHGTDPAKIHANFEGVYNVFDFEPEQATPDDLAPLSDPPEYLRRNLGRLAYKVLGHAEHQPAEHIPRLRQAIHRLAEDDRDGALDAIERNGDVLHRILVWDQDVRRTRDGLPPLFDPSTGRMPDLPLTSGLAATSYKRFTGDHAFNEVTPAARRRAEAAQQPGASLIEGRRL